MADPDRAVSGRAPRVQSRRATPLAPGWPEGGENNPCSLARQAPSGRRRRRNQPPAPYLLYVVPPAYRTFGPLVEHITITNWQGLALFSLSRTSRTSVHPFCMR